MNLRKLVTTLPALALLLVGAHSVHAESDLAQLEEQEIFATKILALINENKHEYAKAAIEKYLEINPDAAPVNRVLAHFYMKTAAQRNDSLIGYRYPDDIGSTIIQHLHKAVELNPNDAHAWSLMVYTHALQGNIEQGKTAFAQTQLLTEKANWLQYNSALLAIAENDLPEAMNRLKPLTFDGLAPSGAERDNIERNAWLTQTKIPLHDPSLDTMDVVRNGMATRVDIKIIPEYLHKYAKSSPDASAEKTKPALFVFSSQEEGCTYCIPDLPRFDLIAGYNSDKGSRVDIIYTGLEPWRDVKYYSPMLRGLGVRGAPHYSIVYNGYHYAITKDGNERVDQLCDFIDNPDDFLSTWNPTLHVLSRTDFLHDQLYERFNQYKKHNRNVVPIKPLPQH